MWRHRRTRPHVVERGALSMGADVDMCSGPIQTHLIVGRHGACAIGDRVRIGSGCGIACEHLVTIGDDVVIGRFVQILDSAFHVATAHHERPKPRPVVIGAGAIIGAWCTILPGAVVPPGVRVLPGSVVAAERSARAAR